MGNRLTRIYTRTGDDGKTGMADGSRSDKDEHVIQALGDIDELNSQLAVVICHLPEGLMSPVSKIQNELFDIGAELSLRQHMMTQAAVDELEQLIDDMNRDLAALKEFILPGGGLAASHCHVARAVCRRAERSLVSLNKHDNSHKLNPFLLAYMNRLSDFLFVLARVAGKEQGETEVLWRSVRSSTEQ